MPDLTITNPSGFTETFTITHLHPTPTGWAATTEETEHA